ncbi:MAG: DUF1501 domain-containing protein [Bryobacterales bacterium]|nr:DUF1501 domain-containing protein [Bryobacterales bacterium]
MISRDDSPRNVRLHIRGNHQNLGEEEPRQFPRIIAGDHQPPIENGSGRLELAGWMASERNPLTARVMVNRIWKHHFGSGIVRTVDNFGKMGEAPSHPELLDWLANRFVASGWSVKQMHRLMVLSSTYRMSSRETAEAAQTDPRNALLHHMPVRRLENGHRINAKSTDKPIAGLLKDLKSRGLLDQTLVVWGGEFGRTPCAQFPDGGAVSNIGRDHNPFGFTMWMAGGGIKGGRVYGATDEYGYFAVENKVHVHDLHATMLHLLGFDHTRLTFRYSGRDMRLTDVAGNVVKDLLT